MFKQMEENLKQRSMSRVVKKTAIDLVKQVETSLADQFKTDSKSCSSTSSKVHNRVEKNLLEARCAEMLEDCDKEMDCLHRTAGSTHLEDQLCGYRTESGTSNRISFSSNPCKTQSEKNVNEIVSPKFDLATTSKQDPKEQPRKEDNLNKEINDLVQKLTTSMKHSDSSTERKPLDPRPADGDKANTLTTATFYFDNSQEALVKEQSSDLIKFPETPSTEVRTIPGSPSTATNDTRSSQTVTKEHDISISPAQSKTIKAKRSYSNENEDLFEMEITDLSLPGSPRHSKTLKVKKITSQDDGNGVSACVYDRVEFPCSSTHEMDEAVVEEPAETEGEQNCDVDSKK